MVLSAVLLELPFPLAGPLPPWRSVFAWFALVPLLWAIVHSAASVHPHPVRRSFLLAYTCGVLWYVGNCYWIRDVMSQYGDMPPFAPTLLLVGFSLVLGLYFGLFGLALALVFRATGSPRITLAAAPVFWVALELAAARFTSVPWDQLGYSQVDNALVNQLAPFTGVYGISFLIVFVNALIAVGLSVFTVPIDALSRPAESFSLSPHPQACSSIPARPRPRPLPSSSNPTSTSPDSGLWTAPGEWERHLADFARLAAEQCKTFIAGIPQTGASSGEIVCPPYAPIPDLIVWPESPAPFFEDDARFQKVDHRPRPGEPRAAGRRQHRHGFFAGRWRMASVQLRARGQRRWSRVGRYDKIHLVPFGEYVPFSRLLFFARKLTGKVSSFDRGDERKVFRLNRPSLRRFHLLRIRLRR